ncbi:hypothetical protein [Paenibacillus sinopodophylli]|uniref:Cap15 family cyclic dinucleotide receptor domain-containing protein n=1 Tax=Paenibacillus sinopodophylli TaxID=1837342 RepID=UPI00110CE199|nr:hypothetical protein [Paenibacillus sinopodophylli]
MHEYSVIGHPRKTIILILALVSGAISKGVTYLLETWIVQLNIVVSFTISTFTVFALMYFLFNHFIWKWKVFSKFLHFPNLNGEWECIGLSNNIKQQKQYHWNGTVVIKQTWDKMLVSIKTGTSTSQSMSLTGGIKHFPGLGYKMSYHYENTPNVSEVELKKHEGFCILTFDEKKISATGCYFNNIKDRATYGEMNLRRREENGEVRLLKEAR